MEKMCLKVSYITIVINFILSGIKLLAGIFGHSSAMISDAVHSISDVFSTIVVIVGLKLADVKSDKGHQYGHERLENVAALVLSFVLLITGIMIGGNGLKSIYNSNYFIHSSLAIWAAIISILVKEWMYWYTIVIAKKANSDVLKADAWHHRSDALSSIGSLIGIIGCILGVRSLDVIASLVISLIIIKVAIDIFIESIKKMIDCSCDDVVISKIENVVVSTDGVMGIDSFKSRLFGNKVYIDLEIVADKNLTFKKSHDIAHDVHDRVEKNFQNVKHCMVHINPK